MKKTKKAARKKIKYCTRMMIDIRELRRGSAPSRILRFYSIFGEAIDHDPNKPITIWKPKRVALIIEIPVRRFLKERPILINKGKLKEVRGKGNRWSYAVVPLSDIPDEALAALNEMLYEKEYVNPTDLTLMVARTVVDKIPKNIYLPNWKDGLIWKDMFPELLNFSNIGTWKTWEKMLNVLRKTDHTLTRMNAPGASRLRESLDLRVMAALSAIELEVGKRRKTDPDWHPTRLTGFLIDGCERAGSDWPTRDIEIILSAYERGVRLKGEGETVPTLYECAREDLVQLESDWQARRAGMPSAPEKMPRNVKVPKIL